MKQRYKVKCVAIKQDTEIEELKALNEQIQRNRDKHAAEQLLERYRSLFMAVSQRMQEDADAAQAEEKRQRKLERRYRHQMRKLINRITLCVAIGTGVALSWQANLVTLEFLLGVCFICCSVIAFACGRGQEKRYQFGGERR